MRRKRIVKLANFAARPECSQESSAASPGPVTCTAAGEIDKFDFKQPQ
jgi:hypothetical protein